ncbi:MAG: hypothetical protein IPI39_18440 [Candidatus Obscuribacter sp.]|nr:hypothetical protein [Candidatus Obscuribacter sp.]
MSRKDKNQADQSGKVNAVMITMSLSFIAWLWHIHVIPCMVKTVSQLLNNESPRLSAAERF